MKDCFCFNGQLREYKFEGVPSDTHVISWVTYEGMLYEVESDAGQ